MDFSVLKQFIMDLLYGAWSLLKIGFQAAWDAGLGLPDIFNILPQWAGRVFIIGFISFSICGIATAIYKKF